jgi:uncharacterized membrane protein
MNEIARTSKEMIDLGKVFQRSWALFQSKPVEHLVAGLIVIALSAVTLGVLFGPLSVGQIRMIEKQQRGETPRIEDVFAGFGSFGASFLTTLILFVAVFVGMLLLVLPGVFVGLAWGFAIWFVALEGASPSAALSGSWQLLKNHTVSVIVVFVLLGVVNAVASSIVLATLLTAPLSMIFGTLAFQEMVGSEAHRIDTAPRA